MRTRFLFFLFALLTLGSTSPPALSEVYKWVNDQGQVEYSDQYREGAEKVTLQPLSTIQMPKLPADAIAPTDSEEQAPAPPAYQRLAITFPTHDSAFHSGNGDVVVTLELTPDLLPSHSLRLSLDGQPVGVFTGRSHTLPNVDRGTHVLSLDVVDNTSVIQSATPVTFTIHRPMVR